MSRNSRVARQVAIVLASTAFVAVAASSAAQAYAVRNWNSESNPLVVKNEGGTPAGAAFGTWTLEVTSNGTRSHAYGYLKDLLPNNGYNVYFKLETYTNAGTCVSPQNISCDQQWYYYDQAFSGGTKEAWNQGYWSPAILASTGVNDGGDYARAHMYVQESNNLWDPYAGPTITNGDKY